MADTHDSQLEYTGQAASAVFETPELLENILNFLVSSELDEEQKALDAPPPGTAMPSYYLYRLLRVNKIFRNTIRGSPSLQCAMFLRPFDASILDISTQEPDPNPDMKFKRQDKAANYQWGRVTWVLSMMRSLRNQKTGNKIFKESVYDSGRDEFFIECLEVPSSWGAFDIFVESYGAPESSWRKIEVCAVPNASLTVWGRGKHEREEVASFSWQFTSSMTPGMVFEEYQKIVQAVRKYGERLKDLRQNLQDEVLEAIDCKEV